VCNDVIDSWMWLLMVLLMRNVEFGVMLMLCVVRFMRVVCLDVIGIYMLNFFFDCRCMLCEVSLVMKVLCCLVYILWVWFIVDVVWGLFSMSCNRFWLMWFI